LRAFACTEEVGQRRKSNPRKISIADDKGFAEDPTLVSMGRLDSDLEDVYRRRHGAFQVMLASVTGSIDSARDVVQEAFALALRDQRGFRCEGSLEGWVWRIALRVAVGSKGSRELAVDEVPDVAFVDESSDQALAAAVRELPPQRRMTIFLRYFAGLSYAEIGEVLGIAEGTVAVCAIQVRGLLGSSAGAGARPPDAIDRTVAHPAAATASSRGLAPRSWVRPSLLGYAD
jgi:RNA polymerase sigma factor (sigma-70 family)